MSELFYKRRPINVASAGFTLRRIRLQRCAIHLFLDQGSGGIQRRRADDHHVAWPQLITETDHSCSHLYVYGSGTMCWWPQSLLTSDILLLSVCLFFFSDNVMMTAISIDLNQLLRLTTIVLTGLSMVQVQCADDYHLSWPPSHAENNHCLLLPACIPGTTCRWPESVLTPIACWE